MDYGLLKLQQINHLTQIDLKSESWPHSLNRKDEKLSNIDQVVLISNYVITNEFEMRLLFILVLPFSQVGRVESVAWSPFLVHVTVLDPFIV